MVFNNNQTILLYSSNSIRNLIISYFYSLFRLTIFVISSTYCSANNNIIVFRNCCDSIANPISPKSIFTHIASTFLYPSGFVIFTNSFSIIRPLIFQSSRKNCFFTTSRIYSTCGLVKFPVLILSYNLSNAISNAPIPLKKLLNLKSSNKYGIVLYSSTNM